MTFCSTTHCQRFVPGGWSASEPDRQGGLTLGLHGCCKPPKAGALIDQRGQLVEAYFGASCGGETAKPGDALGRDPA